MPKTPSRLIEISTRHQLFLEGHKTHIANKFADFLAQMARSIDKRLLGKELTTFTRDRLETLLGHVRDDLRQIYQGHYGVWREQIIDLAEYEAGFERRSLNQVVDNYDFKLPSRTQLKAAVFSAPLSSIDGASKGQILSSFYRDWSSNTIKKVEGIIRAGYYQGQTTPQIVRQIKGARGMNFRDGQLARGNRDMMMLTRTAVQHAAGEARNETWNANRDIVKGVRIVATLDSKTTLQCQSLDGTVFPIDSGPRPPFHIGCRSTTVASLDSRFDILDEGATRSARNPDGKVVEAPAKETYYEWLKRQPKGFQDEAIGPKRGKLLREGGISAKRFSELNLGRDFEPRTLDEMRKLEPLAFEKAGM